MLVRKIATVLLALGILGITSAAFAQDNAVQKKEKSLVDRLDDLGKAIFGGILPAEKTKPKNAATPKTEPRPYARKPAVTDPADEFDIPQASDRRAGSILTGSESPQRTSIGKRTAGDNSDIMPENTPPAVPRTADGTLKLKPTPKPVRRPLAGTSLLDESDTSEDSTPQVSAAPPRKRASDPSGAIGDLAELPNVGKSALRPLHERLSMFRQSVFGADEARSPRPQPNLQPGRTSETSAKPAARSVVAQRTKPDVEVGEAVSAEPLLDPASHSAAVEKTPAAAKPESNGGVLMTRKGPVLGVETLGPRRISVGKESTYEVSMINSGEVAGEELVVFVSLPEWAEVVGAEVSSGVAQANATGQTAGTVQWKLGRLDAKGRERLTLKIVPRQSRPFDLAVRWEYKPVASQATIEVQEPKLALQLEGPREVLYGKKEVYRLKLTNTGSGSAENVAIMLMPIGGGENVPATHKVGMLSAGEEKVLDVELTARQAGNLTIQVDVRADGGVHAELAEKVLVRRAGLKIDVEGPKVQFVGAAATYAIRIRNPGTAPAKNVRISVVLPAGAKYLAGIEGARLDASGSKLDWTVETISPEVEQNFALKCSLGGAGISRVQLSAAADDDLTASAGAVTRVEAVANLTMDVKDPEGPVAVGDEATYQLRVRNRGTKEAEGVEVFAYFSRGIEPTGAEGGPNRLGPGQVTFQPIPSLAPGAEVVFTVRARADAAGNHVFRAEALCKPLGARLIREATNLYYADVSAAQPTARESGAEGPAPDAMRTVTRSIQGEQTPAPPRK